MTAPVQPQQNPYAAPVEVAKFDAYAQTSGDREQLAGRFTRFAAAMVDGTLKIILAITFLIFTADLACSDPPAQTEMSESARLPEESPSPIDQPPSDPLSSEKSASDPAAQRIREALQGGQTAPTAGLLGDVLDVIREKGSILDGSSLDLRIEADPVTDESGSHASGLPPRNLSPTQSISEAVKTAELLLRSARRLERMAGIDDQCVRLIHQMRVRATSMLTELYLSP